MKFVKLTNCGVSHLVNINNIDKLNELDEKGFKPATDKYGNVVIVDLEKKEKINNSEVFNKDIRKAIERVKD